MRSWSSDETGSNYSSSSSIDTQVDGDGRLGHRVTRSHGEDRNIRRSLQRKLLSNNGARLSRIERRLLRADHSREGAVSVATFKAALAAESKSDGAEMRRHEMLWLTQMLAGRNGRNVAILKMRRLLEDEDTGGGRRSATGGRGQGTRNYRRRSEESMLRKSGSNYEDGGDGRSGSGDQICGSESSRRSRGGAQKWRSSPPPPARWAIRQGTVGQWLHEVAAPMVSERYTLEKFCLTLHVSFGRLFRFPTLP